MDWSVSMTSQGIVSVEWQLCTYHDDSDACMLQCLLLLYFFILSVFFLSMIWGFCSSLPCNFKNVLSVKSNSSPIPGKSVFLTPWPRVSNFIMFAIMILFTAAKV